MTSLLSLTGPGNAAPASSPPPPKPTVATLAASADVPTLTVYVRQHPQDRAALETAMVKAGRAGDVSRMSQALKKPDYDVAVWMKAGGPAYATRPGNDPAYRIGDSGAWAGLERDGKVSASEHRIIGHVAANEGRLDSVQTYDNQTVSLGAIQKTVNPQGTGELPRQAWHFMQSDPARYQSLFADRGWMVERVKPGDTDGSFALRLTVDGKILTPHETYDYIKDRTNPDHWNTALDPLLKAGRDPAFQTQQIKDFKTRLDTAAGTMPTGYAKPARDYVTSEQGAAMLLDHHVNRPAHVAKAFGAALDRFYADNPQASRDPAAWTAEQRATYEPAILDHYRTTRTLAYGGSTMTHALPRADRIMGAGSPLSAQPGSFARAATP